MAKAGFWLRGSKGKLAGASIGKGSQGGTVIREIVTPKNPQTTKQMIQRIIWNSIIKVYAFAKEIADHSFEGVQAGAKTQQAFMKENVNALRTRVANEIQAGQALDNIEDFSPLGSQYVPNNTVVLSKGSLPTILASLNDEDTSSIEIAISGNTYQDVIDTLGLQRGDQLTFVQAKLTTSGDKMFKYARVILDPMQEGVEAPLDSEFIVNGAINLPNPRNEGTIHTASVEDGKLLVDLSSDGTIAIAAIASRYNGTEWLRSNSSLVFSGGGEYTLAEALSAGTDSIATIDSRYLNNSGTGNVASFNSGGGSTVARITSITVNGMSVASSGSTTIAKEASNVIVVNALNADGQYAAYKVGNGDYVVGLIANNKHQFTDASLVDGNTLSFAIGEMNGNTFTPSKVWGGSALIDEINPVITAVTVGGVSIANSGTTDVRSGANKAVAVTTDEANGMYMAYRKGTGAWSTPVVIANNSASANLSTLADDDEITVAIGTGSTSATFTASQTWGGKAKGYTPEATAVVESLTYGGTMNALDTSANPLAFSANSGIQLSYVMGDETDVEFPAVVVCTPQDAAVGTTVEFTDNVVANLTSASGSVSFNAGAASEKQFYIINRTSLTGLSGTIVQVGRKASVQSDDGGDA